MLSRTLLPCLMASTITVEKSSPLSFLPVVGGYFHVIYVSRESSTSVEVGYCDASL